MNAATDDSCSARSSVACRQAALKPPRLRPKLRSFSDNRRPRPTTEPLRQPLLLPDCHLVVQSTGKSWEMRFSTRSSRICRVNRREPRKSPTGADPGPPRPKLPEMSPANAAATEPRPAADQEREARQKKLLAADQTKARSKMRSMFPNSSSTEGAASCSDVWAPPRAWE